MNETTRGPKFSHVTRQKYVRLSFSVEMSMSLFEFYCVFSKQIRLAKTAHTSSMSCSSHRTLSYSTEEAVSMNMDHRSQNVLAADSRIGSVSDFLCRIYRGGMVNKLCESTKHAHTISSMTSKPNFNLQRNQFILCSKYLSFN